MIMHKIRDDWSFQLAVFTDGINCAKKNIFRLKNYSLDTIFVKNEIKRKDSILWQSFPKRVERDFFPMILIRNLKTSTTNWNTKFWNRGSSDFV